MTEKELKRLSRAELLEMLIEQRRENEELRRQIKQLRTETESRRIALENSSSLAEAALKLGGVFKAADEAAKLYLENIEASHSGGKSDNQ